MNLSSAILCRIVRCRLLTVRQLGAWILPAILATPGYAADATITGTVPLPNPSPAAVMAKRYEVVSRAGVLSTIPPVSLVWLEGEFPDADALPTVSLNQEEFVFEPALLPIQVGTTVEFPNFDPEYHNVFSYSATKRFDLGRYLPNESPIPNQVFDVPGIVVVRCDIHEHMRAIILVIDSPFFVASDIAGAFRLEGLPAGNFTLKAWVNSKTTLEMPVTLTDGQTVEVAF